MKISELIQRLTDLQEEVGDLPVVILNGRDEFVKIEDTEVDFFLFFDDTEGAKLHSKSVRIR